MVVPVNRGLFYMITSLCIKIFIIFTGVFIYIMLYKIP